MEQPKLDEKLLYDVREITNAANIHAIGSALGPYLNGPSCFMGAKSEKARDAFADCFNRCELILRRIVSEAKKKKSTVKIT